MTIVRAGLLRTSWYLLVITVLSLVLASCPDPFSAEDDAVRDLDRPLAAVDDPDYSVADPYDTRPAWSWESDSAEGTGIFRFRLNGGEWTTVNGVFGYSPADTDEDLYPGTYVFEVQERNVAGIWSVAAKHTTVILARPPEFSITAGDYTNTPRPSFLWQSGTPAQYGATERFSWRLERWAGTGWEEIPGETHSDQEPGVASYTIASALTEGMYRFGAAERNVGGARSAYEYTTFTVDLTPPAPPSVFGPDIIPVNDPNPAAFTWTHDTSDTLDAFSWRLEWFDDWVDGYVVVDDGSTGTTPELNLPFSTYGAGIYRLYIEHADLAGNTAMSSIDVEVAEVPMLTASLTVDTSNSIQLGWTGITSTIDEYEYQQSTSPDFSFDVQAYTVSPATTTVLLENMAIGTTFYYRVRTIENGEYGYWSNTEAIATSDNYTISYNGGTASGWFGGDDSSGLAPRNVGVGFGFTMPVSTVIDQVGYEFTTLSSDSGDPLPATLTMVVDVRDAGGVIIKTLTRIFTPGEWDDPNSDFFIVDGVDLVALEGETYIFTFYIEDAHLAPYPGSGARGASGTTDPNAFRLTGTGNSGNSFDLVSWASWSTHTWRPHYFLSGNATQ
jgi:hypothetical protein